MVKVNKTRRPTIHWLKLFVPAWIFGSMMGGVGFGAIYWNFLDPFVRKVSVHSQDWSAIAMALGAGFMSILLFIYFVNGDGWPEKDDETS